MEILSQEFKQNVDYEIADLTKKLESSKANVNTLTCQLVQRVERLTQSIESSGSVMSSIVDPEIMENLGVELATTKRKKEFLEKEMTIRDTLVNTLDMLTEFKKKYF